MSKQFYRPRKQKFVKKTGSEFRDPIQYFLDTKVSPGEAVNWIVFWNGCHAHYSAEYGRSANELKGMEVKPRAEDPGEVPEEPDLANMSAK